MRAKAKMRMLNGYRVVHMPEHPRSMTSKNWLGYVYEHRVVAEKFMGRPLRKKEVVHHLDGDRANNRADNLLVLENSQHTKLHAWISKGVPGLSGFIQSDTRRRNRRLRLRPVKDTPRNRRRATRRSTCKACGATLQKDQTRYCSHKCHNKKRRSTSNRPSKKKLSRLLLRYSKERIGRHYGVSGVAVRKWAIAYGIEWRAKELRALRAAQ